MDENSEIVSMATDWRLFIIIKISVNQNHVNNDKWQLTSGTLNELNFINH